MILASHMNRISIFQSIIMLASVLSMATPIHASEANFGTGTRTLVDMTGASVTIPAPKEIRRVAVLTSPLVQVIFIVGEQDKLCAMTASQRRFRLFEKVYPRQKSIPAPRAQMGEVDIEVLLAARPQCCIGSAGDMEPIEKAIGLPVIKISTSSNRQIYEERREEVALFGRIFGRQDRARRYDDYLLSALSLLQTRTSSIPPAGRLKVYMGYGANHMITYGRDTYMHTQIETAGCLNAAQAISSLGGKEGGLAEVSFEHALKWDPDIIVIDTGRPEDLRNHPMWGRLAAVRENRVHRLPVGGFMWNRPSCESAVMLPLWLATKAYPSLFRDISLEQEIKRYWRDVISFELGPEDIRLILDPTLADRSSN